MYLSASAPASLPDAAQLFNPTRLPAAALVRRPPAPRKSSSVFMNYGCTEWLSVQRCGRKQKKFRSRYFASTDSDTYAADTNALRHSYDLAEHHFDVLLGGMPRAPQSTLYPRTGRGNHIRFWLQCGSRSMDRHEKPKNYEVSPALSLTVVRLVDALKTAVKLARKFFNKALEGKEIFFRATYAHLSTEERHAELHTVEVTQDNYESIIPSVEGLQILIKESSGSSSSVGTESSKLLYDISAIA